MATTSPALAAPRAPAAKRRWQQPICITLSVRDKTQANSGETNDLDGTGDS